MKAIYENDDYVEVKMNVPKPAYRANAQTFGCSFCWDSRKKQNIELFFLDKANNLRTCNFCPYCGRSYEVQE